MILTPKQTALIQLHGAAINAAVEALQLALQAANKSSLGKEPLIASELEGIEASLDILVCDHPYFFGDISSPEEVASFFLDLE